MQYDAASHARVCGAEEDEVSASTTAPAPGKSAAKASSPGAAGGHERARDPRRAARGDQRARGRGGSALVAFTALAPARAIPPPSLPPPSPFSPRRFDRASSAQLQSADPRTWARGGLEGKRERAGGWPAGGAGGKGGAAMVVGGTEARAVPGRGFYDIEGALAREAGGVGGPGEAGAGVWPLGARRRARAGGGAAAALRGSREHVQLWRGGQGVEVPPNELERGSGRVGVPLEQEYDNEGDEPDWIDWENNSSLAGVWTYEELLALDEGVASRGGLSPGQLGALPIKLLGSPGAASIIGAECAICLDTMVAGQEVVVLCCSHAFHVQCLKTWAQKSGACPCCRESIVESSRPE